MRIDGTYFDGVTSTAQPCYVEFSAGLIHLYSASNQLIALEDLYKISIPPVLGSRRQLRFQNGGLFETEDLDSVSALEREQKSNRAFRFVHWLESRWSLTIVSVGVLVLAVWCLIQFGLPRIAQFAARSIPIGVLDTISQETLTFLDENLLEPSELSESEIRDVNQSFSVLPRSSSREYELVFRRGNQLGANAFALPSGSVILTDEIVSLLTPEELDAVLVHEISHIEERHSLRKIIQDSGVFVLISLLAGDMTSVTTLASTLPTLLVESGYSRKFETEADIFAARYLISVGRSTLPLRSALRKLEQSRPARGTDDRVSGWLSTHPLTEKRITQLKQLDVEAGLSVGE